MKNISGRMSLIEGIFGKRGQNGKLKRWFDEKCGIIVISGCGAVGSARLLGSRGRWFKSSHPDHVIFM